MVILKKKLVNKLISRNLSISTAESCTGGLLSSCITSIPSASKIFNTGLITYSNSSKNKLLKIPKKILKRDGAVSKSVCILMIKNLCRITKTDICVSITGIAGPSGGSPSKPVGLIYVGIKYRKKLICKKFLIKNKGRNYIQKETVKKTLQLISLII
jgi:PncC family amidohydrolase